MQHSAVPGKGVDGLAAEAVGAIEERRRQGALDARGAVVGEGPERVLAVLEERKDARVFESRLLVDAAGEGTLRVEQQDAAGVCADGERAIG